MRLQMLFFKAMKKKHYFTKIDILLWIISWALIITTFFAFSKDGCLNLIVSLIGVIALILAAKGNPIAQLLMIVFAIIYAIISFECAYYGEMITYAFMSGPMAAYAFFAWIKNPYKGNKSEVKVNVLSKKEIVFMFILTCAVTIAFYFILKHFNTANLEVSTLSVTTSFLAVYMTARRSPFYAVCYAANDIVLVILWIMMLKKDIAYLPVVICFSVFFVLDIYGFISWRQMQRRQAEGK